MYRSLHVRRSLAVTAVLAMATAGGAATAAADPGKANGHGNGHASSKGAKAKSAEAKPTRSGAAAAEGRARVKAESKHPASPGSRGTAHRAPANPGQGQPGSNGKGSKAAPTSAAGNGGARSGDPAGNNGTVKIETLGDEDGIPNNTPHPGCSFQVEWYGFDEGSDIISTVDFAEHAPTGDAVLSGASPSQVFVGGDPATGAGTETGIDGVQPYRLSFDGEPHAQQGYHVKLTVTTPYSQGNDDKSKVFWVEPCEDSPTPAPAAPSSEETEIDTGTDTITEVLGIHAVAQGQQKAEVRAARVSAPQAAAGADQSTSDAAVPTAVEAGDGNPALDSMTSPWTWALAVLGLGGALTAGAVATRRASTRAND